MVIDKEIEKITDRTKMDKRVKEKISQKEEKIIPNEQQQTIEAVIVEKQGIKFQSSYRKKTCEMRQVKVMRFYVPHDVNIHFNFSVLGVCFILNAQNLSLISASPEIFNRKMTGHSPNVKRRGRKRREENK